MADRHAKACTPRVRDFRLYLIAVDRISIANEPLKNILPEIPAKDSKMAQDMVQRTRPDSSDGMPNWSYAIQRQSQNVIDATRSHGSN
jgi:hypothetical protein